MAREQARNGWLTNNQYLAILANPDEYQDLMVQALPTDLGMILNLQEECLFMCAQDVEDVFNYDIQETYGVTFNDEWSLTVKSYYNDVHEQREYTMRNNVSEKLVHYQRNNDAAKIDKIRASRRIAALDNDMEDHGQSSRQTKEGILSAIRGHGRRGRGGRARGPN